MIEDGAGVPPAFGGKAGEGLASGPWPRGHGGRCAVVILPAEHGDHARLTRSIAEAEGHGRGDFAAIEVLPAATGSPQLLLAEAAREAVEQEIEWLLAVSAAETLAPDIFVKTAPALRVYDAIWGGAGLAATGKLERISRLAAQNPAKFFHAALAWWIGRTHFVRPAAALEALSGVASSAWYADYMRHLWVNSRAYKTAQCLTLFERALPPLLEADRRRLIDHLRQDPVFMTVAHAGAAVQLPYTGLNPLVEREQARGLFFEHEELLFLAGRLPRGLRIVDVGANTGNHTIFFAAVMRAEVVIPLEPHPRAAAAIRAAAAVNELNNIDLSCLGVAAGAASGRLEPVLSAGGGLGATRYLPRPDGAIRMMPLDGLVSGRVDLLKIDVEGMEMDVLAGAEAILARDRPAVYIEVLDKNVGAFMGWVDVKGYRVEKLFPDKTHCNYFLTPADGSRDREG